MREVNFTYDAIQPEVPKVIDNEQLLVYVPLATNNTPGAILIDSAYFVIVNGKLKLTQDIAEFLYNAKEIIGFDREIPDLDTEADTIIGAISELHSGVKDNADALSELSDATNTNTSDIADLSDNLDSKFLQLSMQISYGDSKNTQQDNDISTLYRNDGVLNNNLNILKNSTDTLKNQIGTTQLNTDSETVTEAVNELLDYSKDIEDNVNTNHLGIVNLNTQVQGIARTFVSHTFQWFLRFIRAQTPMRIFHSDGTYTDLWAYELKTGDNVLITEQAVPDFWYEHNMAAAGTEEYEGESLDVIGADGVHIGTMHFLEVDYAVIQESELSAQLAATEAKEAAKSARSSSATALTWATEANDDAYRAETAASAAGLSEQNALSSEESARLSRSRSETAMYRAESAANRVTADADKFGPFLEGETLRFAYPVAVIGEKLLIGGTNLADKVSTERFDSVIGDIDSALDSIIGIQDELTGGETA